MKIPGLQLSEFQRQCSRQGTRWLAGACLALGLTGGLGGPDYERTAVDVPEDWRWKVAELKDHLPRGEWWTVFKDSPSNDLQRVARTNNYDLKATFYRFEQARSKARISRSELLPTLEGNADWTRYRTSGNFASPVPFDIPSSTQDQWTAALDLSYGVDLWGRVRRSFESARMDALTTEAAYESVLLTLQSDVAAIDFIEVADSEAVQLRAKLAAVRGSTEQRLALARAIKAAGGGWNEHL